MEFVAVCMLLILVWTAFSMLSAEWNRRTYSVAASADAQALLEKIYNEAVDAKAAGPGYSHAFAVPAALAGNQNYTVSIYPAYSTIQIAFKDSSASAVLPFSASGSAGCCTVRVTNDNGNVVFS
jgi:hypothetical protein